MARIRKKNESAGPSPSTAGLLALDIRSIKPYDHNPRRTPNPEHDRIKASIRAEGMDQPLIVTKRPGETEYMIAAGGNSRLQILKELHAETGDARFATAPCVYRPWTSEADVLLAHLRENDLRGSLTFIEKALAVDATRRFLEAESEKAKITQARLAELLRARGYSLTQGLVSQMAYAVERLLPLMPRALEGGLGRPQVEHIRTLDRAVRALWLAHAVDSESEYEAVFAALCRRYDNAEWDIGLLRRGLEAEAAERAGVSIQVVAIELEARLLGREVDLDEAPWEPEEGEEEDDDDEEDTEEESALGGDEAGERGEGAALSERERPTVPEGGGEGASLEGPAPGGGGGAGAGPGLPVGREAEHPSADTSLPSDLRSLRARALVLAGRLASRHGLGDLILPLPSQGLGFLLRDVPDASLVERLDADGVAQVSMLWWHLAAACEVTVAPLKYLLPRLAEGSVLKRALERQDAQLLFSSVWTLDPGHIGYRLWQGLQEGDWQDLLALMATYRALHRAAEAKGERLWR